MDRIRKQEEFKVFQGKRQMERARKPDLKPKERNDDKPSQEILDQIRYIGGKVHDSEM